MIFRRLWHSLPAALLGFSFALHFITIVLYVRLPIRFAAITVFPIWVWGVIGLSLGIFCYLFHRTRFSLTLILIWVFTILLLADEARSLGRLGMEPMAEGPAPPYAGSKVLRVVTMNCAGQADPTQIIGDLMPDIIFLQEIPHAYRLKQLVDKLFNGNGDYRYHAEKRCAVLVKGTIHHEIEIPGYRSQLVAVEMRDGRQLELLNIHLQSAATNMRFYQRECWREHIRNRTLRQIELSYALAGLRQKTAYPRLPAIVAGDFNAPANDTVYRIMDKEFSDAFGTVGTGWGNTYHRALPLLRIDHIYCSDKLVPVRSRTFKRPHTDHRLVVADFVYR